ncbi:MAG: PGPGW domain-containing protein [Myxococcota bacterium]|jgi:Flp pilus assembly protein TadB|nr:PGPGW domain-containing protein [Myxococcota bacterium]
MQAGHAKRLVTLVVGASIIVLGIAMLVLPGPATIVIPLGIVILAGEFAWARRLLRRVKELASSLEASLDVEGAPLDDVGQGDFRDHGSNDLNRGRDDAPR